MSFSKKTVFLFICSAIAGFSVVNTEAKNPVQAAWHAQKAHGQQKNTVREKQIAVGNTQNTQQASAFLNFFFKNPWLILGTALLIPIALCTAGLGIYLTIFAFTELAIIASPGYLFLPLLTGCVIGSPLSFSTSAGSSYLIVRNIQKYNSCH